VHHDSTTQNDGVKVATARHKVGTARNEEDAKKKKKARLHISEEHDPSILKTSVTTLHTSSLSMA
jgi:hypothetical protein